MKSRKRDYTVDAVVRSLVILEALAQANRDMGVLEISKAVKIHVSTVYRLLSTLMSRGFVEQNAETDKYRLGIRLFELGMARIQRMDFRTVAVPYLRSLQDEVGETVFLGTLWGDEVLIIEAFSQFRGIVFRSQVGSGEPLYCTGIGKALLAHLRPDLQEQIIRQSPLKSFTPNTITRKAALREELRLIRERGYSIDNEEIERGVKCVGAAILNHEAFAVAAFSVAGPKERMEEQLEAIIEAVLSTSEKINTQLGYRQLSAVAGQGNK